MAPSGTLYKRICADFTVVQEYPYFVPPTFYLIFANKICDLILSSLWCTSGILFLPVHRGFRSLFCPSRGEHIYFASHEQWTDFDKIRDR